VYQHHFDSRFSYVDLIPFGAVERSDGTFALWMLQQFE